MMKLSLKYKGNHILISITAFLMIITSCSKKMQPVNSSGKIETNSELNKNYPSPNQVTEANPDNQIIVNQTQKTDDFKNTVAEKLLDTHKTSAEDIIGTAQEYLGVPHCMGGTTRKCMDCSGLLVTVFAEHNIKLPHNAQDQSAYGLKITRMEDLKEGDLVFFTRTYSTKKYVTHSGIYIGNYNFIHTSSNTGVSITSINQKYWKEKFVFGKRLLK